MTQRSLPQPQAFPRLTSVQTGLLQRKCVQCDNKEKLLQRRAVNQTVPTEVPTIVHEVLNSPGQPLDADTRSFMEPRFGQDFSHVRVHTDTKADESAQAVNAQAFTVRNRVVFSAGQYQPQATEGKRLLAHELTHVLQQQTAPSRSNEPLVVDSSNEAEHEANRVAEEVILSQHSEKVASQQTMTLRRYPVSLQRSSPKDNCSGAGAVCAPVDRCAVTDPGSEGNSEKSTGWKLRVFIDTEQDSWEDAARKQEFGHTYVKFLESNGREYSYGFYPAKELPNENKRTVPGCVHHPDTTHDNCIDDTVNYALTEEQYKAALTKAQDICRSGHDYGVNYTCTTYAEDIVRAAGQSIPSSRSNPTTIFYQSVPSIDNPNTLEERVQEEKKKDPSKRQYWNQATAPQASQVSFLAETVKYITLMIRINKDRWVFSKLNGMWMVEMLKVLTELHKQNYLNHLFDFFGTAEGVDKPRLMVAMRAVRLKAATPKPTSDEITAILVIAPNLPEPQKKEITTYLLQ